MIQTNFWFLSLFLETNTISGIFCRRRKWINRNASRYMWIVLLICLLITTYQSMDLCYLREKNLIQYSLIGRIDEHVINPIIMAICQSTGSLVQPRRPNQFWAKPNLARWLHFLLQVPGARGILASFSNASRFQTYEWRFQEL